MPERQQQLFETTPDPWELDARDDQIVATVVVPGVPVGPYSYLVPDRLRDAVEAGRRVRVPLGKGNRSVIGYCVETGPRQASHPRRLKEIREVLDARALLSPAMLRLTRWMAEHYLCRWSQVLDAVLPAGVRGGAGTREVTLLSVPAHVAARLSSLGLPPKQASALQFLSASPKPLTPAQLAQAVGCTSGPIMALRKRKLVEETRRRIFGSELDDTPQERQVRYALNDDQEQALTAILGALDTGRHETLLVHGVTGSGKTEVYIRAIEHVVSFGRQAIVLVPEISLTPQTVQRFRARFDHVAVLHSHLSDAERHQHWQRIAGGRVQVVVGARSAVFAPTPQLGLIVLDEEHEGSFKQDSAPRYHARDVALRRAVAEKVPLVLGSATPALESWQKAQRGEHRYIDMPRRVFGRPLPAVDTIDLRSEFQNRQTRGAVSRQLHQAMNATLRDEGQVILLLNRRGFSTHIQCPKCGKAVECPHCDIALTYHRTGERAVCHFCDYEAVAPNDCPACDFVGLRYRGLGTQRLEAEIKARFPGVPCLRMDTDTMRRPGSHERALARFRSGEIKILLGTQMIAKGLDFPNVTLVGVVNADTALHLPDFRAAERTFQLVTQVAGRTGRGEKGGRVLVQTFAPEHPAIQAAVRHDYATFAQQELPVRAQFAYPPFASLVRIVARGPAASPTEEFLREVGAQLRHELSTHTEVPSRVLGPAAAPIAKHLGKYRFHLLATAQQEELLRRAVSAATKAVDPPDETQWIVDVDALDMM